MLAEEKLQWLSPGEEGAAPAPGTTAPRAGRHREALPEAATLLAATRAVHESGDEMAAGLEALLARTPAVLETDVEAFMAK